MVLSEGLCEEEWWWWWGEGGIMRMRMTVEH